MIKANELRFNNIVMSKLNHKQQSVHEPIIYKIDQIKDFKAEVSQLKYPLRTTHFKYDELIGIPLTEEWILRLGFNEVYKYNENNRGLVRMGVSSKMNNLEISNTIFTFDSEPSKLVYLSGLKQDIKYIHQLQNLYFMFTGEELIIKDE